MRKSTIGYGLILAMLLALPANAQETIGTTQETTEPKRLEFNVGIGYAPLVGESYLANLGATYFFTPFLGVGIQPELNYRSSGATVILPASLVYRIDMLIGTSYNTVSIGPALGAYGGIAFSFDTSINFSLGSAAKLYFGLKLQKIGETLPPLIGFNSGVRF